MTRQSRVSCAKMTNPAGWWAPSPKRYSSAWTGFRRRWWSLMNWNHQHRGPSQLLRWKGSELWLIWIEGWGSDSTADWWWCSLTCTDNIWGAYGGCWYFPRKITNAARDFLTWNWSHVVGVREATVGLRYYWGCTHCGAWFIACSESEACQNRKLLPLRTAPAHNFHIEIRRRRRHSDGSWVSGVIEMQIVIFDIISLWKHFVYQFCYVSVVPWFQWPNDETWQFLCACARVKRTMRMF